MFGSFSIGFIFYGGSPYLDTGYVPGDNDYGVPGEPGDNNNYGIDMVPVGDYTVVINDESNIYGVDTL